MMVLGGKRLAKEGMGVEWNGVERSGKWKVKSEEVHKSLIWFFGLGGIDRCSDRLLI